MVLYRFDFYMITDLYVYTICQQFIRYEISFERVCPMTYNLHDYDIFYTYLVNDQYYFILFNNELKYCNIDIYLNNIYK